MSDALDRLKNRQRPKVVPRDASLSSTTQGTSNPSNLDIEDSTTPPEIKKTKSSDTPEQDDKQKKSGYQDISKSRSQELEISTMLAIETKQSTMRLEKGLSNRLQILASEIGVCREALIESMFEYVEEHKAAKEQVISEAQHKNSIRQQIANYKRAQSMMKKFL